MSANCLNRFQSAQLELKSSSPKTDGTEPCGNESEIPTKSQGLVELV
jgi:hypothetical protein